MHYVLLILLGLSLPAVASETGKTPATQPTHKGVKVTPPCDPENELKMPDFN
jgi:hypothetical protein